MNDDRNCPLKTKRLVVGQITICHGCCCGNVERGLPEVPVEWLKSEWRKRGLLKRVQLTISGCVGPCDVPNVVVITTSSGTEWLGNIVRFDQYRTLLEWAVRCRDAGKMAALPREFHECRISPFLLIGLSELRVGNCRTALEARGYLNMQKATQSVPRHLNKSKLPWIRALVLEAQSSDLMGSIFKKGQGRNKKARGSEEIVRLLLIILWAMVVLVLGLYGGLATSHRH